MRTETLPTIEAPPPTIAEMTPWFFWCRPGSVGASDAEADAHADLPVDRQTEIRLAIKMASDWLIGAVPVGMA
jgi:hypothetical protein